MGLDPALPPATGGTLGSVAGAGPAAVRVLVAAAAAPVFLCYAAAVAVVALLAVAAGAGWSVAGTLRSAAPCWLAAHQVPLTISEPGLAPARLGVLPLLPTIGLVVLVARAASAAAGRLGWRSPARLASLAAVFGGVHGAVGVLIALLQPSTRLGATPGAALAGCFAVAGGAALVGGALAACSGSPAVWSGSSAAWSGSPAEGRPAPVLRGVRAGLLGLTALMAAGALSMFAGLLFAATEVHDLVGAWATVPGGRFGVTVLSVGYLPNAAVAGLSWTAGPGLSMGTVSVGGLAGTSAPLPAVPLLGALPDTGPGPLRSAVLALPLAAGVLVGHRCRRAGTLTDRLHAAVTAGIVTAAGCLMLAVLAGGRLGDGAFDPVRVPAVGLGVAAFAWLVIPAGVIVALPVRSSSPCTELRAEESSPHTATGESATEPNAADEADPDAAGREGAGSGAEAATGARAGVAAEAGAATGVEAATGAGAGGIDEGCCPDAAATGTDDHCGDHGACSVAGIAGGQDVGNGRVAAESPA